MPILVEYSKAVRLARQRVVEKLEAYKSAATEDALVSLNAAIENWLAVVGSLPAEQEPDKLA